MPVDTEGLPDTDEPYPAGLCVSRIHAHAAAPGGAGGRSGGVAHEPRHDRAVGEGLLAYLLQAGTEGKAVECRAT